MLSKTRTIVPAVAVVATLAAATGSASAAMLMRSPATVQPVKAVQPTTATPMKEVGSAGIPGYDNLKCEQMQSVAEESEREAGAASKAGETKKAESSTAVANLMWNQIGSHCLIVD